MAVAHMARPPVSSVRPIAIGTMTTKGTINPRRPMIAFMPAATSL